LVEELAIPVVVGRKTPDERFPGAINTTTCEAMMGDGKALQMGTSHELGQNFARAFEITYQDAEGTQQLAWTTSWGVSTRMMGGLIMAHGDDAGLRLPPRIAPTQVVILVVRDGDGVGERAQLLAEALRTADVRVVVDDRTDVGFGRRATAWELKGVPVRIELGPRDLADEQATLVRRDADGKATVPLSGLPEHVTGLLDEIQTSMLDTARAARDARTVDVETIPDALEAARTGFARIAWGKVDDDGLAALKAEAVTVRCLQSPDGDVATSDDDPDSVATVGRSY
jgi:prolyl-tRNA synthetase